MADQREITTKIGFEADTAALDDIIQKQRTSQEEANKTSEALEQVGAVLAGYADKARAIDEANEKQRQAQEEARKTSEELDNIGVNLAGIGTRAVSAFNGVRGASQSMGTSIRSSMLSSIKSGDSFTKTLGTGISTAFKNVGTKAKGFGTGVKSVAKDVGNAFLHPIQTIKSTLGHALQKAGTEAKGAGEKAKKAGKDFEGMGSKGAKSGNGLIGVLKKLALTALAVGVAAGAWNLGKDMVNAASSAEEMQSKFETVFKDSTSNAENWAENFSTAAKRSTNEVKGFMADAQALFSGIGMENSAAAQMSKEITSLSYDLASFHNLADEDAFAKLRSGLVGETEGLKSMGIILNETALKQSMLTMGIKGTFDELTEAEKMNVRYNAILAQTKDAQTDVTRTSDSYTNSLKGVKGMWADFMANAGAKFTPVLTKLFNVIVEKWPVIEPLLMGVVDVLADGLADAIPILLELGEQLLPIFTDMLRTVFVVLKPLLPVFGTLAKTLLPPLCQIIGILAGTILPPLIQIFNIFINTVLIPLLPIIMQLVQTLLPVFAQLLMTVAQCVIPLYQAFAPLLQAILPLLCQFIQLLVGTLLPPFVQIFNVLQVVLQPVLQILMMLVQAALPILVALLQPLTSVLEAIAPMLMAMSPLLEVIGYLIKSIVSVIGWLIIAMVNGVDAANNFWNDIWHGADQAAAGVNNVSTSMDNLNGKTSEVGVEVSMPEIPPVEIPEIQPVEIPAIQPVDMSAYQTDMQGALDFAPIQAEKSFDAIGKTAKDGMADIGATAADEYKAMGDAAESTWTRMKSATVSGVVSIIAELKKLREHADGLGTITIETGNTGTSARGTNARGTNAGKPIPHNAKGTDNFEGGPTYINEEGGEIIDLPKGSRIIPADKSEKLISARKSSSKTVNRNLHITIDGKAAEEEKRALKDLVLSWIDDRLDERDDYDADDEALQEAFA